ncbi:hypothetical protein Tco_0027989, partial [Tanacetum coccineum]
MVTEMEHPFLLLATHLFVVVLLYLSSWFGFLWSSINHGLCVDCNSQYDNGMPESESSSSYQRPYIVVCAIGDIVEYGVSYLVQNSCRVSEVLEVPCRVGPPSDLNAGSCTRAREVMIFCTIKSKPLALPWGRTPRLDSGVR